ncbi:hypothetical protein [Prosthecobacter algae]
MTPLSKVQITQLCALASKAFKAAQARGALDDGMTAEQYRREGQMEAAQVASLKEANQGHYLEIRGKWWTVIGNLERAFYDFLNAGPENEARRQMAWRLAGQVSALADTLATNAHDKATNEAIRALRPEEQLPEIPRMSAEEAARQAWAYTRSIAVARFAGRSMESLDPDQLEQLGFTIINRTSAKRGVGDSWTRNKSQRRSKTSKKALKSFSTADQGRRGHVAPSMPDLAESGSDRL